MVKEEIKREMRKYFEVMKIKMQPKETPKNKKQNCNGMSQRITQREIYSTKGL